jgi:hypothetical protein
MLKIGRPAPGLNDAEADISRNVVEASHIKALLTRC